MLEELVREKILKKRESYGLMFRIEKQWSHVVKLVMTTYNTQHNESFPLL